MKATVNETANISKLYPRSMGNRAYEVKITHRNKYEYFYIYVGPMGMREDPERALKHLASECDTWEGWKDFRDGYMYLVREGMELHTIRQMYVYARRNTQRLYKLLGDKSYEKFIEKYS